ncbi:MAG: sulfite exporter TauE/SafE family protein, partial [Gammaproteobacteria bacterium]|nr:sulfite exporter TauE/SafE family protein [Gammaproteobacteria bacterium]
MAAWFELEASSLLALSLIVLVAGVVRGFSGFALSAVTMVLGVAILSPLELIPICFWLEVGASIMMLKQGWAQAQRHTVTILALTSA